MISKSSGCLSIGHLTSLAHVGNLPEPFFRIIRSGFTIYVNIIRPMINLTNFKFNKYFSSKLKSSWINRNLFESTVNLEKLFSGSGLKVIVDHSIKGECRDRYWSSPVLRTLLKDKFCEAIIPIRNTSELKKYFFVFLGVFFTN